MPLRLTRQTGTRSTRSRRTWLIVGIAAFLIFDAVLIAFAFSDNKTPQAVGERPGATPLSSTPTPTVTTEPTPTTEPIAPAATPDRVLTALNGTIAYRAITGSCADTPAVIEVTTDSGQTWSAADASNDGELMSVQSITAINEDEATAVVLAASDCTPRLTATFVTGNAWAESRDRLAGNVYLETPSLESVHFPAATVPAPCPVAALAIRTDAQAAVLCSDHSVMATSDSGANWAGPVAVAGATNIDANADGYVVALSGENGCDVSTAQLSQDLQLGALSTCVPSSAPAGTVGLSGTEEGIVWVWTDDALVRSPDGGLSWA